MQNLFKKYLNNQCSAEEVQQLLAYFNTPENENILRTLITECLEIEVDRITQAPLKQTIDTTYDILKHYIAAGKKTVPLYKRSWFGYAAAAILLIGIITIYKLGFNKNAARKETAQISKAAKDVAPGGNKAVLTLSDGSSIILDSAANGNLSQQGGTTIIKLDDGQLAYTTSGIAATEVLYNTITTPRGGQYQLILADGSKVWLNAASSLRFPATFSGSERRVALTGEGYFEVVNNAAMPFKINVAGKGEVEVLGTHFNINSYDDEATINTTLLEGSVKVSGLATHESLLLKPGQQAELAADGQININKQVDVNAVMGWKNGKFIFRDADIKSIMRQIERWYDVEVSYNGKITDEQFIGLISRNVNVSQILKMLEKTGTVQFQIEGKKIIVK